MTPNEDKRIRERLKQKTWNEIKTNDSWAIFKVMSEFVDGYEKLSRIGPCVSVFGSARTPVPRITGRKRRTHPYKAS